MADFVIVALTTACSKRTLRHALRTGFHMTTKTGNVCCPVSDMEKEEEEESEMTIVLWSNC